MLRTTLSALALAPALLLPAASTALSQELTAEEQAIHAVVSLGEPVEAPTAWLGATPHFVMVGTFKDYSFSINVPDAAQAADFGLEAKREYRAAEGGGLDYIDFEVAVELVTNGIERGLEFEFENADFADHPVPSSFAFKAEEFPAGLFSNMELQAEWEWVEKSVIVNEEQLYGEGSLTVALETGSAGADGTVAEGFVGGFVTGTLDGQPIAISFTAPVTEAEIDD